jgi:hypothetical protein
VEGLVSLLFFAGIFFLMMRFGCGAHMSHGGHGDHHSKTDGHDRQSNQMYSCPMHPEIIQSYPGKCPKCGMTLDQQSNKGEA